MTRPFSNIQFEENEMKQAANLKFVPITPPGAIVDNAAFTTAAIDTKGFRHMTIIAQFGALDIAPASSKIRHSDASNMGSPADIAVGGTDYALATATDSDNLLHIFEVDLLGKKRYVDFEITGGDGTSGTYLSVLAILSRPEESPNSATEHGAVVYGTF
jgi:hypothetical protein